jgi:hypothetical protein
MRRFRATHIFAWHIVQWLGYTVVTEPDGGQFGWNMYFCMTNLGIKKVICKLWCKKTKYGIAEVFKHLLGILGWSMGPNKASTYRKHERPEKGRYPCLVWTWFSPKPLTQSVSCVRSGPCPQTKTTITSINLTIKEQDVKNIIWAEKGSNRKGWDWSGNRIGLGSSRRCS